MGAFRFMHKRFLCEEAVLAADETGSEAGDGFVDHFAASRPEAVVERHDEDADLSIHAEASFEQFLLRALDVDLDEIEAAEAVVLHQPVNRHRRTMLDFPPPGAPLTSVRKPQCPRPDQ